MMRFLRLLAPRFVTASAVELSPGVLRAWAIDALLLDLDNTLVGWGDGESPPEVRRWIDDLRRAGIPACIVSNNFSGRVRAVAAALDLPAVPGRPKPSVDKLQRALVLLGTRPERTAIVGDQIFTDILAGNRLGVPTVLTRPLYQEEPARIRLLRRLEQWVLAYLSSRGLVSRAPGD